MKYGKMLTKHLIKRSDNNVQIAMALVAGLAAGAIISVLFAPDSGTGTREKIADKAKGLKYNFQDRYEALRKKVFGTAAVEEDIVEHEVPHFKHTRAPKRKSDVEEILENAHQNGQVQEGQG
ncbi:YtxH domain-containing protein [Pedobacter punctiformis]|uniref:YtxH domain-containing protein n=1 Tax=Pedobacter punctiformis TaxID=3004097 RepID=A0ABT4L3A9_9SPHI|nr:YtxH domain-containing protein [Pedobacter sp. HCMS5-2]MCZ4242409.1 YtxH domain-containing protein [Pedobacter sp. HCMS5-2]